LLLAGRYIWQLTRPTEERAPKQFQTAKQQPAILPKTKKTNKMKKVSVFNASNLDSSVYPKASLKQLEAKLITLDLPIHTYELMLLCENLATETDFANDSKTGDKVFFKNEEKEIILDPKTFGAFGHAIKAMTLIVKISQVFEVVIDTIKDKPKLKLITNAIELQYSYEHTSSGRNGCSAYFYQRPILNLASGLTKNAWTDGK